MAGDWIKVEHTLPEKPEVYELAEILDMEEDEVVGKLLRLFIWYDQHLDEECNAYGVTKRALDRCTGVKGFADAMLHTRVQWLEDVGNQLVRVKNFVRHNGMTAKKRAQTKDRVEGHRKKRGCNETSVTDALPEKRREEKNISPPDSPPRLELPEKSSKAERFEEFWAEYPVKKGKKDALKKWKAKNLDAIADKIIQDVRNRMQNDKQWLRGFIPHGSTYVNQERWQDDIEVAEQAKKEKDYSL